MDTNLHQKPTLSDLPTCSGSGSGSGSGGGVICYKDSILITLTGVPKEFDAFHIKLGNTISHCEDTKFVKVPLLEDPIEQKLGYTLENGGVFYENFGGFHGLERIGTAVVLAYLRSLVGRLPWDSVLHQQLESVRLVFMPIVNPGGMWRGTRANPNGVDLMRNAPLEAEEMVPFLFGGQRFSWRLPWYRGPANAPMEQENQAVCSVVDQEFSGRPFGIAIDCHSGFGINDRIWFPYAHTTMPIAHLPEMQALKEIYDQTHPNHPYVFEPQSRQYLAHGDLWDR